VDLGEPQPCTRWKAGVISYLQKKTGKQVEIGRLALTFFPVAIHIDHFGVKNPPIFPRGYVVQVARIDAELSVGALLHRHVVYSLTDETYAKLLGHLAGRKFDLTSADLRDNILNFYSDLTLALETKKDSARWQSVLSSLDQLKLITPTPILAAGPAK